MKIVTLCIPAHLPRPHAGATPVPYTSGLIDKLELALVKLSPTVIRGPNAVRLVEDKNDRFVGQHIVTPYTFAASGDMEVLDACSLVLKTLALKTLLVLSEDGPVMFGLDELGEVIVL